MRIVKTYSFKGGEEFIKKHHKEELAEIVAAIKHVDAIACLTKVSSEKTKAGQLLFSPPDLNKGMKIELRDQG